MGEAEYLKLREFFDAALRRAKAEGMREAARRAKQGAVELTEMHEQSVRTDRLGYGCAALQDLANQLDARAVQIEEGE